MPDTIPPTPAQSATLAHVSTEALRAALTLTPGDPLPGTRINPNVAERHDREAYAWASMRAASMPWPRTHAEHAADIAEPLYVPLTLGEHELAETVAILRAAAEGWRTAFAQTHGAKSYMPVTEAAIAKAVALVEGAICQRNDSNRKAA